MLCFGYIIRAKFPFFMPAEIVHTTNVLHNIYVPAPFQAQFATALNSALAMLMIEYGGRSNLSGILKLELYELAALPIPNPYALASSAPLAAFRAHDHPLLARDRRAETGFRMTLSDSRRALDEPVFASLGLTPAERDAVYNAAYDAIVARHRAEASVS